ncbi:hypothetical protein GF312_09195 [Candidatus Poribacteria bacterium]|nr:hypothetical protein [Candidatus Poribacteria bacterium]
MEGKIMKRILIFCLIVIFIILPFFSGKTLNSAIGSEEKANMLFGGEDDVDFAKKMWKSIKGYQDWLIKSDILPGKSHGPFVRVYYNMVSADEKNYHAIVKDNLDSNKELTAVALMVQREDGYDPENDNWFWVKYETDGSISKNDKGLALAGKVAKGMDMGCIACHKGAADKDYIFINDEKAYGR